MIKSAYLREMFAFRQSLQQACRAERIDYFLVRTDQPLDATLTSALAARQRSVR